MKEISGIFFLFGFLTRCFGQGVIIVVDPNGPSNPPLQLRTLTTAFEEMNLIAFTASVVEIQLVPSNYSMQSALPVLSKSIQQLSIIGLPEGRPVITVENHSCLAVFNAAKINSLSLINLAFSNNNCPSILMKGTGVETLWMESVIFSQNSNFVSNFSKPQFATGIILDSLLMASIVNSGFVSNQASAGSSLYAHNVQNLTIYNTNFLGNTADIGGSAIWVEASNVFLDSCYFIENTAGPTSNTIFAEPGGTVWITGPDSTVQIFNITAYSNTADNGGFLRSESPTVVNSCTFVGNMARNHGGAVECYSPFLTNTSPMLYSVIYSSFSQNFAPSGGGFYVDNDSAIRAFSTIQDCQFSNNSASGTGGAVLIYQSDALLMGSRLVFNMAHDNGAAVYLLLANLTINDATITQNLGPSTIFCDSASFGTVRYLSIYDNQGADFNCAHSNSGACTWTGLANLCTNCIRDRCSVCSGNNSCVGCDGNLWSMATCSTVVVAPVKSSGNVGLVILIAVLVGIFGVLIVIGIVVAVIIASRKRKRLEFAEVSLATPRRSQINEDFTSLSKIEIPFEELVFKEKLGVGAFGVVYKGGNNEQFLY